MSLILNILKGFFVAIICFTSVAAEQPVPIQAAGRSASVANLSDGEKKILVGYARKAIEEYIDKKSRLQVPADEQTAALKERKGCFVTLTKNGALRGCIGYLVPKESLCDCVVSNAVSAAERDPRFMPVTTREELDALDIEISVLSVPQKLNAAGAEEVLQALTPGKDGVILKQGRAQATYLPQVWEHFPEKEDFLRSLCRKGRMAYDCWKDCDTEIYLYHVEVIRER
jgi:AmmeMemoRadiSam system protein A